MTHDVTIVIPTRERPDFLRGTLHSVLASSAEAARQGISTRVLVVDDASPSGATRDVARELGVDYERIDVHSGHNNPAAAIVRGVSLVTSRYQSLFGDDDIMLPRSIPLQVARLEEGFDVCSSDYTMVDATLATIQHVNLAEPNFGDLLVGRITINDGAMTRAELVRDLPWDASLDQEVLYAIWLELMYRGARFTHLGEPTFLYRRHTANVSNQLGEQDARQRSDLQERYRALVVDRDGALPVPTPLPEKPPPVPRPRRRRFRPWRRVTGPLGAFFAERSSQGDDDHEGSADRAD